jgi:hypothetical protein
VILNGFRLGGGRNITIRNITISHNRYFGEAEDERVPPRKDNPRPQLQRFGSLREPPSVACGDSSPKGEPKRASPVTKAITEGDFERLSFGRWPQYHYPQYHYFA